jgi:hypothetical protein
MSHDFNDQDLGELLATVKYLGVQLERNTAAMGKLEDRLDEQDKILQRGKGAFFLLSALGGLGLIVVEILSYIKGV